MKLTTIYLLLILSSTVCLGQGEKLSLTFINKETREPVEGVTVFVEPADGQKISRVTDENGKITLPKLDFPIHINARHVGFQTVVKTASNIDDLTFEIEPSVQLLKDVQIDSDPYQDVAIDTQLFDVRKVDRKVIDQLGGNNLSDVLNYNMNMTIVPDVATGRSTVNMFGLSGEYVKILVDNVPIAGDNGSGNNIDISQINLENVERIEISEGTMGVQYGSNAVAGVINIITKKHLDKKWEIQASVQEESVGTEYDWFDEGRHIQNLQASVNVTDKLYASAKVSRNDFKGFFNHYKGKNYDGTDDLRGYEWNPKEQLSATGLINFDFSPSVSAFYKFEFYNETLDIYDHTVNSRLGIDGEPDHTATDEQFWTNRFGHQVNVSGDLGHLPFWIIGSWQKQERLYENYTYNIDYQSKTSTHGKVTNQSSEVFYSKGNLNDLLSKNGLFSLDLGYEAEYQKGYDAIASGNYSDRILEQDLWYTGLFLTTPFTPTEKLSFIPGLRFNHNSRYNDHLIWSSAFNYQWPHEINTKLVVGSAYKTPNFSQLYYYFVDANHNVTGNADLTPEDGFSLMLDIDRTSQIGDWQVKVGLKAYHYNIDDKITLVQILDENSTGQSISRFTYLNADNYKNYGATLENAFKYRSFDWLIGMNYIFTKQYLEAAIEDYAHTSTFSATSRMSYAVQDLGLRFGLNVKYNGPGQQFYQSGDTIEPGELKGYTLMGASIQKSFLDNSLNLTVGGRNLLNVISVNASGLSAGGGHDGVVPTTQFFSTGRSWFLKLSYVFHSNQF